ncbi:uncharacterized protein LOC131176364 [Hevea brasiliensis]|uniref:uncharacterized protein LOC131176364 n=1 Tax=Hevea brasiliensis TaxID=3981 RepID=UPI0025E315C1|nr:uncharacterized protein LOC131176364 [Hevea brasiliensis]
MRFWMRNMLRDQRFDWRVRKMKVVLKITNVFTKPIVENPEEGEESPEEPSVDVIQLDSLSEALISPIAKGQELDNWATEDIPVLNLEKNNTARWDQVCQEAFEKIKQYLSNLPILIPPVAGRLLILYMAVQLNSMGCVLGQHDDTGRKERTIYYLSKKFNDCELRYSSLEKTCCALAWMANRLKHYMLNHKTWLISRMNPIKYVFERPFMLGRTAKWQVILSQYDIVYITRNAVKGSVIADLLAENPIQDYEALDFEFPDEHVNEVSSEDKESTDVWEMYFDGAVNLSSNGIRAVLNMKPV